MVIPTAVNVGLNALKAAAKTSSVTRVVYTSSSLASTFPSNGVKKVLDQNSYNEEGIRKGWKHPEDEPDNTKGLNIYAALKTEAEKACWKWLEENKPDFVFNSVVSMIVTWVVFMLMRVVQLPNVNFSKVLVPEHQGTPSTIAWGKAAFTGDNFSYLGNVITPRKLSTRCYPTPPNSHQPLNNLQSTSSPPKTAPFSTSPRSSTTTSRLSDFSASPSTGPLIRFSQFTGNNILIARFRRIWKIWWMIGRWCRRRGQKKYWAG